MQRGAAVAANFRAASTGAEPVAAPRTFRIDALNRPAGKVLHATPKTIPREQTGAEKSCGLSGCVLVVSSRKLLFVVAMFQDRVFRASGIIPIRRHPSSGRTDGEFNKNGKRES